MSEKKEYIERGALSKFVRDMRKRLPKDSKDFFTRDEMLLNFQQYVDAQPAADVEPVVRCRDCIDYEKRDDLKEDPDDDEKGTCKCHCIDTWADHYCGSARHKKHFAHMERSGSGE